MTQQRSVIFFVDAMIVWYPAYTVTGTCSEAKFKVARACLVASTSAR